MGAAVAGLLGAAFGLSTPQDVSAHGSRECSNATLRGDYGFLASGVKALGPGTTERFTASGIWTFDGNGTFTHGAGGGLHGELSGTNPDSEGMTGEYEVNSNCTGTMSFQPPIPVPPLRWTIVIVGNAREVKAANATGLSTLELTRR
jgi:hypothetical protein